MPLFRLILGFSRHGKKKGPNFKELQYFDHFCRSSDVGGGINLPE